MYLLILVSVSYTLMITCPSGIVYGNTQDVYCVLRSPTHLGMIGTLLAVHCLESCLLLSWYKVSPIPAKLVHLNLETSAVRLWYCCCVRWRYIFSTGRYVLIDSSFCVLKGLIQSRKKGIFACAVIKNRRHWIFMVPGKYMEDYFWRVEVGGTDSI